MIQVCFSSAFICFSLWAASVGIGVCEGGVLESRTAVFFWAVTPGVGKGVMGAAGLLLTDMYRVCCGVDCVPVATWAPVICLRHMYGVGVMWLSYRVCYLLGSTRYSTWHQCGAAR